jgi:hypothetical protein
MARGVSGLLVTALERWGLGDGKHETAEPGTVIPEDNLGPSCRWLPLSASWFPGLGESAYCEEALQSIEDDPKPPSSLRALDESKAVFK